jgi:DNA-directed RNA polymerase subunit RPC12/RpoP
MIAEKPFGEKSVMGVTLIINCPTCGGFLLAAENQKTRTCPYCGSRIELRRANKVASAESAFEASEILRELKDKRQSNVRRRNRDSFPIA